MSAFKQARMSAARLLVLINELDGELKTVTQRMKALQKAGLIYASEYWRDDRYLYLVHPMKDGSRQREYVGADQKKIAKAQAGIERGREFDSLAEKHSRLSHCMENGLAALRDAERCLSGW